MKRTIQVILAVLILSGCVNDIRYSDEVESALDSLDDVIVNKEMIEGQKEYRISVLRDELNSCAPEEKYDIYNSLFVEYFQYDIVWQIKRWKTGSYA